MFLRKLGGFVRILLAFWEKGGVKWVGECVLVLEVPVLVEVPVLDPEVLVLVPVVVVELEIAVVVDDALPEEEAAEDVREPVALAISKGPA
jgi:hypothetical protein